MRYIDSGDILQPEEDKTKYTKTKGKVEAVNGNKIPDHRYKPAYVNETTSEEQKELERIKKELSDSMKKKEVQLKKTPKENNTKNNILLFFVCL